MTSEVALLNRLAVALAADSATTVTYFEDGERKERYFKGANKVFNLSASHPVGLMTNGAGSLQKMPWEVIVKAYRESRGPKALDTLAEYPRDFFKFLASKSLFPADYQERQLVTGVSETAGNIAISILVDDKVKQAADDAQRKMVAAQLLAERATQIDAAAFLAPECAKLAAEVKKSFLPKIAAEFKTGSLSQTVDKFFDTNAVLELAASAYFKARWTDLETTGIVIAGYGEKELFPALEQYECYGVVLGTVIHKRLDKDCHAITFDVPSVIVPIAQDKMVYTFMFGASVPALVQFADFFGECATDLVDELLKAGQLQPGVDTSAIRADAEGAFRDKSRQYVFKEASRLRRVIGMLSMKELAELAETFVSIESLKERVTVESESVSGPIDVAVISKGDGFIWVKRKHYFDPALNIRFVAKKQQEAKE